MRATKALFFAMTLQLLCACSSTSQAQTVEPKPYRILILHMSTNGESHQVLAANIVSSATPLTTGEASSDTLNYLVTDVNGAQLQQGSITDPTVIRSPLSLPGEPQQGHKTVVLTSTEYLLRLPYSTAIKSLHLVRGDRPIASVAGDVSRVKAQSSSATVTSIDLSQWLPAAQD